MRPTNQLLSSIQPRGALLPSIVFFRPTEAFVKYIKKLNPFCIIDVGAGMGHMSNVLQRAGVRCCAIDVGCREDTEVEVYPLDALIFNYPANSLPIMARPCHGPWTDATIRQAMDTVPLMLYVGLEKNIDDDLFELDKEFKLTRESFKAGKDGEIVVRIEHL